MSAEQENGEQVQELTHSPNPDSTLSSPLLNPITLRVKFKRVSVGSSTVRFAFDISAGAISKEMACLVFCERRLDVILVTGNGQKQLEGMEDEYAEIEAVGDTKALSVKNKSFGSGITFSLEDVPKDAIMPFAEVDGEITVRDIQAIPEKQPKEKKKTTQAADPKPASDWGKEPLSALEKYGLTESKREAIEEGMVAKNRGTQVVDLRDWIKDDPYWHRSIKGVGESYVDKISEFLIEYYEDNPMEDDDDESVDEAGNSSPTIFDAEPVSEPDTAVSP